MLGGVVEQLGANSQLGPWAVFAALHLPELGPDAAGSLGWVDPALASLRQRTVRGLVARLAPLLAESREQREFLVQRLRVPAEWVAEGLSTWAISRFDAQGERPSVLRMPWGPHCGARLPDDMMVLLPPDESGSTLDDLHSERAVPASQALKAEGMRYLLKGACVWLCSGVLRELRSARLCCGARAVPGGACAPVVLATGVGGHLRRCGPAAAARAGSRGGFGRPVPVVRGPPVH